MTYENDMTSNSGFIKTALLEHEHASSFLTVMAERSVLPGHRHAQSLCAVMAEGSVCGRLCPPQSLQCLQSSSFQKEFVGSC